MRLLHRSLLVVLITCAAAALAGCAGPGRGLLTPVAGARAAAEQRAILAVTTRAPAAQTPPGYVFSGERGVGVSYARLHFAFPPHRAPGELPVDADHPDPQKHITLVDAAVLDATGFARALNQMAANAPAPRKALVFVHGYNTSFDAAAMRLAQIAKDTGFRGVPVLFSWPSRGGVTDYGYDRASADFSRDALEALLRQLSRDPRISGVDIFAHSMGNWLTMEALRQLAMSGDARALGKLQKIVLAAPDVDMDVFRKQAARLGALARNMTVYVSRDDYALRVSRRLAGDKIRAGENTDIAQFTALGMDAHDLSNVAGGMGRNHGKAFGDGATIAGIGAALASPPANRRSGELLAGGLHSLGQSVNTIGQALLPGQH